MAIPVLETFGVGNANGTTVTVTKPSGTVQDDLLVVCLADANDPWTAPAGWTVLVNDDPGFASLMVAWLLAGASEPASYDFVVSVGGRKAGVMARISGAHLTTPIHVDSGSPPDTDQTGTDATVAFPTVTTTVDDCLLLFCEADFTTTVKFNSFDSSVLEVADENNAATHAVMGELDHATAGISPSAVNTMTTAGEWTAFVLAVQPPAAAGGGIEVFRRRIEGC